MKISIIVTYRNQRDYLIDILDSLDKRQHYDAIRRRIGRGWSATRAIDRPINRYRYDRQTTHNKILGR